MFINKSFSDIILFERNNDFSHKIGDTLALFNYNLKNFGWLLLSDMQARMTCLENTDEVQVIQKL